MAVIGGEGSNINQNFLDAYRKISDKSGTPAAQQIENIRNSVDNKLVNAQEQVDPTGEFRENAAKDNRRELNVIEKFGADAGEVANTLASSAGNFFFGEEQESDSFLEKTARFAANAPLGIVAAIPSMASGFTEAGTGTSFDTYDPKTATVDAGEDGSLNALGRAAAFGGAAVDALSFVPGLGVAGRAASAIGKGAAKAAGKGISGKFGNGLAKEGESVGEAALSGWQRGLGDGSRKLGKLEEGWEKFGQKNFAARGLTTAAEEAVQEGIQGGFEWTASNDDKIVRGEADFADLGSNVAWSAYGGAVGGAFMGGIGGLMEQHAMKKSEAIKAKAVQPASTPSSTAGSAPDRFAGVPGYNVVAPEVAEEYKSESKPSKIPGQSTIVTTRNDIGVNSFEGGRKTLAAIYSTPEGQDVVNAQMKAEADALGINLVDAILAPQLYENGTEKGEQAAKADLNKVLDKVDGVDGLIWKDPANGYQIKLTFRRVIEGNQVRVNQAIAGLFNGDFDTDRLSSSLDPELLKTAIPPTHLLANSGVAGKINMNLDYVHLMDLAQSKLKQSDIADAIMDSDVTTSKTEANKMAKEFLDQYEAAGKTITDGVSTNQAKANVLANLFAKTAPGIKSKHAEKIFAQLQDTGVTVATVTAQANTAINAAIVDDMKRSNKKVVDQSGAVPADTGVKELAVAMGKVESHRSGKPLREAAVWMFSTARGQDPNFFTTPAAIQKALKYQNITALGEKPQDVLKMAFRMTISAEMMYEMTKMEGGKISKPEDFDVFKDIVNKQRTFFENAVEYKELDGKHIFDGFVGKTEPIREQNGAIKAFQQVFGDQMFTKMFVPPEGDGVASIYDGVSINQVFKEIAKQATGGSNAFSHYGPKYEMMWINGIKSTYKASATKQYEKLLEVAEEATSRQLHPGKDGVIPVEEMGIFNARWAAVTVALRQRVVNLGLYDIASIDRYEGFYDALTTDNPKTLLQMMASLAVIDETMDMNLLIEKYNADPTLSNAEMLREEALRQIQLLSPPYQLIAAEILDQLDAKQDHIKSELFSLMSNLHTVDKTSMEKLNKLLVNAYADQDLGTSYGHLLVDLLVTTDDEMALGQLGEDFTRARAYSRRASRSDEELADARYKDVMAVSDLLGDSPDFFVWVLSEMTKEPVLWADEVMSETFRTADFPSNATKEKARVEEYSKIVHAGRALVHGGNKTEENKLFLDTVYKVEAESFFSDPIILQELLFGDDDVSYELTSPDGKTKIIDRAGFFEWAIGEKFDPSESARNRQIFEAVQKRKMLLSHLLPRGLATNVKDNVKFTNATEAARHYTKRRNTRNEIFVQNRNLRNLKEMLQEDISAIRFVYYRMSQLNKGNPLPSTNKHAFFELYKEAMRDLPKAIYYNLTKTSSTNTAKENGERAKITSMSNYLKDMGEKFNKLDATRLGDQEQQVKIKTILNQRSLDLMASTAATDMFGSSADNFLSAGFNFDMGMAKLATNKKIEFELQLLEKHSDVLALSMYNKNMVTANDVAESIKGKVRNATDAALTAIAKADPRFNGLDVDSTRAAIIADIETNYTPERHQEIVEKAWKIDTKFLNINKMPDTLEEFVNDIDPGRYFKGSEFNHFVGEGVDQVRVSTKFKNLVDEFNATKTSLTADLATTIATIEASRAQTHANAPKYNLSAADTAQIDIGHDHQIAWAEAIAEDTLRTKTADLEQQYEELVAQKNMYRFYSLQIKLQGIGSPMNPRSAADLDTVNDQFLDLVDRYREELKLGENELNDLEKPPYGAVDGEVFIPQFSTTDPTLQVLIASLEASISAGDVMIGTALGAIGSGRRSGYAALGYQSACKALGQDMLYEDALALTDAVSMLVDTADGKRVIPVPKQQTSLIAHIDPALAGKTVTVYRKNECTCPGCCAHHDLTPVYNENTKNNAMSIFFSNLAYFMEEVEQLLKKKTLGSGKALKAMFENVEQDPTLRPVEIDTTDINAVKASCIDYTTKLTRLYKQRITDVINQMKDDAQSRLLDPDFFADRVAEFTTRFVQLNVYLADGTKMSEYQLKNMGLEDRINELKAMSGVADVKLIALTVAPEHSERAAIRFQNDPKNSQSKNAFLDGLQDEGVKIQQNADGVFSYTESVTYKPDQINLDYHYAMTPILRPGKNDLPPGADASLPWMNFTIAQIGGVDFENAKPRPDGSAPLHAPSFAHEGSLIHLDKLGTALSGSEEYFLVNLDVSNPKQVDDKIIKEAVFKPSTENGQVTFGRDAAPIKAPVGKKAMIYLAAPNTETVNAYCKKATSIAQTSYIFVPDRFAEAVNDADYQYTAVINDHVVIVIDPMEAMANQTSGGFRAQTIEKSKDFMFVVETDDPHIGDGVIKAPMSMKGEQSTIIRQGSFKLKELMKDRVGEAVIVPAAKRQAVIDAYRKAPSANGLFLAPKAWGGLDDGSKVTEEEKASALKKYSEADLTEQGLARDLIDGRDIAAVIALPPLRGDKSGMRTYYPLTLAEMGLGSAADVIMGEISSDNSGFDFHGFTDMEWDDDTFRKFLGDEASIKATLVLSDRQLAMAANGQECAEMKADDIVNKMLEARASRYRKMVNFFHTKKLVGNRLSGRSIWWELDDTGTPVRASWVNPDLNITEDTASMYESSILSDAIIGGRTYKYGDAVDTRAEEVLRQFCRNCKNLGASVNKLLSPMISENGKATYKVFDDEIMPLYFTNIPENDVFLMFNYITNGEFCPPNTLVMEGDFAMNFEYKMRMHDGSFKHFTLNDHTFNTENISIVDGTSDNVTYGLQQAVRKLVYAGATKADLKLMGIKQNLDAEEYEQLIMSDADRLKRIERRQKVGLPPSPPLVESVRRVAESLERSVGHATESDFIHNMNDAFQAIVKAYSDPAKLHVLNDDGSTELLDSDDGRWTEVENAFIKATGFKGKKMWTRGRLIRFISSYMSYSVQDSGIQSFSLQEVKKVLNEYGKLLQQKNQDFPRPSTVSQPGDISTRRMGSCGRLAMLQEEWTIPNVRKKFNNNWNDFLTAAGVYQRKQAEEYRGILGATDQKLRTYHYLQVFLQDELNDIVPGGVGKVDLLDVNGPSDKEANDILRMFGIEPEGAAMQEAMKEYSVNWARNLMEQEARDRGAYAIRRAERKDKDGNTIPSRAGHEQKRSAVGDLMNMVYSLRVANGLILNPALIGANLLQTAVNGNAQKIANRISFYSGGKFKDGIGVQPRDMNLLTDASHDTLLGMFFKLQQMTAFYDDPTLLHGFFQDPDETMERVNQTLKSGPFARRWIRQYARFSADLATGKGSLMKPLAENYLFRFGQYMGDMKWLSDHIVNEDGTHLEATSPIMSQTKWEAILSNEVSLHQFLADISNPEHELNVLHRAAIQDSLRITWARKTIVTEMLSSVLTSLGNSRYFPMTKDTAEGLIAVFATPFWKYYSNFSMFAATAMNGVPCETLLHIAHHKGLDVKQWLIANGVKADIINRIDFEAMASSRSMKEAMLRDAIKFGGVQFLGMVAGGMLQLVPPEDDDLKDNFEEYSIGLIRTEDGQPFRIRMLWPLQDILGPFAPVAVYWSTVMSGNPRPGILAEGFTDLMANNATMTASNLSAFFADPLMWQRETNDTDMGKMNGANVTEEDPAITSTEKLYMQGVLALYKVIVPSSLDKFLNGTPGTQDEVSSNYIYEVDDSGRPTERINPDTGSFYLEKTSASDAAWRRMAKNHPIMGMVLDIQNNLGGKGGTGYTRNAMPNIIRYSPFQMASAEMYELNGDLEHDEQIAADVITMLASFDDMDELMETGFYINAETRFFVGQKVWDAYYSYQSQIDEAYALGLNDFYALGNGDYLAGQKVWSAWEQSMKAQKQFYYDFYYDKVNSSQLRTRMETANVMRQSYDKDANGEYYGTGFANDNPWSLLSIGSRFGNAGNEGGWSSIDPLTNLPIGERGWKWNTANTYYDGMKFEEYSKRGDGKGYSSIHVDTSASTDLATLESLFNPGASKSGYTRSSGGYSRSGGGGGGGGSSMPKLYSNPQDVNADRPTLARMSRLYDSQMDYIRPDWETKGSNKASRRSDI